ncbi:hypothetical protein OESDEN_17094 [Oesophagostomum dentatum]|uniref:SCP domain-containing protein n=1 Tax=Oesophagostomum dentatum TaxID=61180 RepID=A0A0B1SE64_OESDE|nr:hypothetical protein OESDEN_17094 [Oesophagostomum dentatum]
MRQPHSPQRCERDRFEQKSCGSEWSDDLAQQAQERADLCQQHLSESMNENHGANMDVNLSRMKAAQEIMRGWMHELPHKGFRQSGNNFYSYLGISHSAKMLYDQNTRVGCGLTKCKWFYNAVCRYER